MFHKTDRDSDSSNSKRIENSIKLASLATGATSTEEYVSHNISTSEDEV